MINRPVNVLAVSPQETENRVKHNLGGWDCVCLCVLGVEGTSESQSALETTLSVTLHHCLYGGGVVYTDVEVGKRLSFW